MAFAIVPHAAANERLFSILVLTKTKTRNGKAPGTLYMTGQMRAKLHVNILRSIAKQQEKSGYMVSVGAQQKKERMMFQGEVDGGIDVFYDAVDDADVERVGEGLGVWMPSWMHLKSRR
ncbi:hypothetical protein PsorP6_001741 [Peronosclerospora sorghi]|uniref:Uncharacterized protein n=1 Tax=Peronosclerospora sorghi TaxID=230839 RepID=A0ACC0WW66_9STRA|nr:hypothetical protein PsorP6_001741 [Peronosclerospora sorghi]